MKLNCIAIDDEPLALEKIKQYINKINYLNLLKTFYKGSDALSFLLTNKVDILFLDIQMDDLTGIQLLEAIKLKPKVIITTAYDDYAIKGFELDVSDYLLKPFSFQRFLQAVDKIYALDTNNKINSNNDIEPKIIMTNKKYIFIKTEYRIEKVNLDDILYIEGMKDYLQIHTEAKKILTLQNFNTLLKYLPEDNFIRVHKSYVVALNKISSVEKRKIFIKDANIPIGETYIEHFLFILQSRNLIM